jgi:hypothetical protein
MPIWAALTFTIIAALAITAAITWAREPAHVPVRKGRTPQPRRGE